MSSKHKYKNLLWTAKDGYNYDISKPAEWDGLKFMTDCDAFHFSISHGSQQPYWQGRYPRDSEWNIITTYVKETKRNKTFLDIGGHIGTMAIPFSKVYNKVCSFEPCTTNYSLLLENITLNNVNNIDTQNVAISDHKSKVNVFRHDEHNSGCYAIQDDINGEVECVTLDSLGLTDIDFIKIDVQGSEMNVIRGALETIKRYKPLLMIEASNEKQDFVADKDIIVEFLSGLGYNMYHDNGADIFMCQEDISYRNEKTFRDGKFYVE